VQQHNAKGACNAGSSATGTGACRDDGQGLVLGRDGDILTGLDFRPVANEGLSVLELDGCRSAHMITDPKRACITIQHARGFLGLVGFTQHALAFTGLVFVANGALGRLASPSSSDPTEMTETAPATPAAPPPAPAKVTELTYFSEDASTFTSFVALTLASLSI